MKALAAASERWLALCADRVSREKVQPVHDALLLLADAPQSPLIAHPKELAGGF